MLAGGGDRPVRCTARQRRSRRIEVMASCTLEVGAEKQAPVNRAWPRAKVKRWRLTQLTGSVFSTDRLTASASALSRAAACAQLASSLDQAVLAPLDFAVVHDLAACQLPDVDDGRQRCSAVILLIARLLQVRGSTVRRLARTPLR